MFKVIVTQQQKASTNQILILSNKSSATDITDTWISREVEPLTDM